MVPWGISHLKQKLFVLVQSDLRYGKTGNKKHATCFLTLPQNVLNGVLPSMFKPVLLLQITRILSSDWINLGGSHSIHGHHRTCCKPRLAWDGPLKKINEGGGGVRGEIQKTYSRKGKLSLKKFLHAK